MKNFQVAPSKRSNLLPDLNSGALDLTMYSRKFTFTDIYIYITALSNNTFHSFGHIAKQTKQAKSIIKRHI